MAKEDANNIIRVSTRWNLKSIHDKINGNGINVAVLDSGINKNHEAFKNIHLEGENFIDGKPDDYWCTHPEPHGTMVAGIVAQYAPRANIFICCVRDNKQYPPNAVIKALKAINRRNCDNGKKIHVIVMSFGHNPKQEVTSAEEVSKLTKRATLIDDLVKSGTFCVAAVGNNGLNEFGIASPASLPNVIAVGALDKYGYPAQFNNAGQKEIDVYAPGEKVSYPHERHNSVYAEGDGTSCAAPAIAGIVALILQHARDIGVKVSTVKRLNCILKGHMLKNVDGQSVLNPATFFLQHKNDSRSEFELLLSQEDDAV